MRKKVVEKYYKKIEDCSIEIKGKKIVYNEIEYSENDFLKIACSYVEFSNRRIKLKNTAINMLPSTIKVFFERNVSKMSFFGLFFPCALFLLVSFITFSLALILQNNANFENFVIMGIFISFFFLGISIVLIIKILSGEKVYLTEKKGKKRIAHISSKKYREIIEIFDNNILNEHYYFKPLNSNNGNFKICIREFKCNDVKIYYNLFKNPNIFRYLIASKLNDEDEAKKYINKCINDYKNWQFFKLAIEINDELIGYIGLSTQDLSENSCQIVYAIGENYWGKGYTTEIVRLFVDYLYKNGKKIIYAGHVDENIASKRVLEKNDFLRIPNKDYILKIHGEDKQIISYIYSKCIENLEQNA